MHDHKLQNSSKRGRRASQHSSKGHASKNLITRSKNLPIFTKHKKTLSERIQERRIQRTYGKFLRLELRYINMLTSFNFDYGIEYWKQRVFTQLFLLHFFIFNTEICYDKNGNLNKKNLDKLILEATELRLNDISKQIRQLFNEACEVGQRDPENFDKFKSDLAALTADSGKNTPPLPEKAPELYKQREDRKEKPDAFIRRVYAPWLGKGLMRPHIKGFDKSLYQALYKHGFPEDFEALLPAAQGKRFDISVKPPEQVIKDKRAYDRKWRQQRRKNKK